MKSLYIIFARIWNSERVCNTRSNPSFRLIGDVLASFAEGHGFGSDEDPARKHREFSGGCQHGTDWHRASYDDVRFTTDHANRMVRTDTTRHPMTCVSK